MKLKWHLIFLFFLFIIGFAAATVQRTEETLVKDSFQVDPSNYKAFEFRFDLQSMIGTRLAGSFLAQGNNSKDIEVYVMDEYALINWKNGFQAKSIFDSGRVSAGVFDTAMDKDHFYVIVDNSFSDSVKNVSLRLDATFDKAFLGLSYYSIFVLGALIFAGAFYGIIVFYGTKTQMEIRDWLIPAIVLILLVGFSWFFNPNVLTLITGLVSLVVAVSTFENIRLTRKTVEEMKATRISQTRPHVIVDLELENFLMFLALRNIGNGVARDVVLNFDPPLGNSQGMVVSEMPLFKKVDYFAPDKKIRTLFDSGISYFGASPKLPRVFNVSLSYVDDEKKEKYEEVIKLDLSIYESLHFTTKKDMNDLVKETDAIKKTLERIERNLRADHSRN